MAKPSLTDRVEILERKVRFLEGLPERITAVELQIVQLRDEMRREFSAVREEMSAKFSAVREEMSAKFSAVREDMNANGAGLRDEIREGDEETRRYMRVLHEEVISRIAAIQEGRRPRRKS